MYKLGFFVFLNIPFLILSLHSLHEMDIAIALFVFTPSRAKAVQFLVPLEEAEHSFIIKVLMQNMFMMYLHFD